MQYINKNGHSLSIAVWLATDSYDHNSDPNHISATGFLKPTRQIILGKRAAAINTEIDIGDFIPTSMGSAIHNSIELAWKHNAHKALKTLGYPKKLINNVLINPEPEQITEESICVYMEKRVTKTIAGVNVSGKYDFVGDGILEDFKSGGVYAYMKNSNEKQYRLQGSIYRWLNPDIVTNDYMLIQYIFTDWSKLRAQIEAKRNYPPHRLMTKKIALLSLQETENFMIQKIEEIRKYIQKKEPDLPYCTTDELWQAPSVFKYYKNPEKRSRSTANFNDYGPAQARLLKDKNVGVVVEVKGQAKRCNYCNAYELCTQKDVLITNGTLTPN